jgi:predicted secreted hydrolase
LVNPARRALLLATPGLALGQDAADDAVRPGRALAFPRDHGAHPAVRIEWWYATGWLEQAGSSPLGFQVTFFRSRTGLAESLPGRFAPRQLLFAHAALSDIGAQRHQQAQRITRWSGDPGTRDSAAQTGDTRVHIGQWRLQRDAAGAASRYRARVGGADAGFELDLAMTTTQPVLLQGQDGFSRKGPQPAQASHYYSQPHLQVQARVAIGTRVQTLGGRGWLDHEWSDELLPAGAVGWDWIGINLDDGGALTAFRLRRADGSPLWAGGSHRTGDGRLRAFAAHEVQFAPQRTWTSPGSLARYPVDWRIRTPSGRYQLRALMDAQELDGRASNGAVYWEGLSDLMDDDGRSIGRGYLEMTGYAGPLRL